MNELGQTELRFRTLKLVGKPIKHGNWTTDFLGVDMRRK